MPSRHIGRILRRRALATGIAASGIICSGCAHHRADQYAFAPPYAPPVYPQPAAATMPPTVVMPDSAQPVAAMPAATVNAVGLPHPAGAVVTADAACPPCAGMEGVIATGGTVMDGGGQTPPCPPGP